MAMTFGCMLDLRANPEWFFRRFET